MTSGHLLALLFKSSAGDEPGQSLGNSQTCMNDKQQSDQQRHHEREARQTFMISSPDEPERIGKSFHRSIRAPSGDCPVGQMDYGRSEERHVGKASVSPGRSRGTADHKKKKKKKK